MASTRSMLQQIESQVAESMGMRDVRSAAPVLSPIPQCKDMHRRPAKGFGRLEVDQVIPDPTQPRAEFDEESLARLAANLRSTGQLHPIHVRWSDESQHWIIISGERRWRAARLAGLSTLDCFFHERPLTQAQILELQLIENLLRDDLRPIEEARAFQTLIDVNGWTGKQLAESLHLPASKISRSLALLSLPKEIQTQVDRGSVPARTAYELSKVRNDDRQRQLAARAASGSLTTAGAAQLANRKTPTARSSQARVRQTYYAENGWTVTVSSRTLGTYHHIELALLQALDEVRLRIANNVRL